MVVLVIQGMELVGVLLDILDLIVKLVRLSFLYYITEYITCYEMLNLNFKTIPMLNKINLCCQTSNTQMLILGSPKDIQTSNWEIKVTRI